jgi:hypothetical protein
MPLFDAGLRGRERTCIPRSHALRGTAVCDAPRRPHGKAQEMGRSRFRFGASPFPHFLTCTVVGWLTVFTRPETVHNEEVFLVPTQSVGTW